MRPRPRPPLAMGPSDQHEPPLGAALALGGGHDGDPMSDPTVSSRCIAGRSLRPSVARTCVERAALPCVYLLFWTRTRANLLDQTWRSLDRTVAECGLWRNRPDGPGRPSGRLPCKDASSVQGAGRRDVRAAFVRDGADRRLERVIAEFLGGVVFVAATGGERRVAGTERARVGLCPGATRATTARTETPGWIRSPRRPWRPAIARRSAPSRQPQGDQ
jgi:hypothetical protein